jgi:hypothetical protein
MGNSAICKSTPCGNPKPVYKTVLSQIFQIAYEKPRLETSASKSMNLDSSDPNNKSLPENVDVPKLEAHVKSHVKALIDYLEGSHNKVIDTGAYLHKVITGSFNPEVHMLGILTINELLNASSKFSHDKSFLEKLRRRSQFEDNKTEENVKDGGQTSKANKELDNSSFADYAQNLRSNIVQFEDYYIEIVIFLLDDKRNPFRKASFKHVLKSLELYTKNHVGTIPSDKGEVILNNSLATMENYQALSNKEDLEVQLQFLNLLMIMAKNSPIIFNFKHKFINHGYSTLKTLYEQNQNNQIPSDGETKELVQNVSKASFNLIEIIVQSVFDLNEFGVLITPLFAFFDNTQWKNTELQTDIFMSIIDSMNNTSFEQVEVFLIDKIVEYIDYDKYNTHSILNTFKHNGDIGVKIRVFSLLETIFERTKKTFLSFLVIDNITISLVSNLRFLTASNSNAELDQFRETLYSCEQRFIEKISGSSKNLVQMINAISGQIYRNTFRENRDDLLLEEMINMLCFTLDRTTSFPSQYAIPKESVGVLLKIRGVPELLPKTYRALEKLFNIRSLNEEAITNRDSTTDKKSDLLFCPPDIAYAVLASNLNSIKNFIESSHESLKLLNLIIHAIKINDSLLMRKEGTLLVLVNSFMKKIMDLSLRENLSNQNKGLLVYCIITYLQQLHETWNVTPLATKYKNLSQALPADALKSLDLARKYNNNETEKILPLLQGVSYIKTEDQKSEHESTMQVITTHLRGSYPNQRFEHLDEEFEELDNIYAGSNFVSIADEDSHRNEASVEHINKSLMIEGISKNVPSSAKNTKKGNIGGVSSLMNFNTVGNSQMNSSLNQKNENVNQSPSSSYIDHSFENALKEARKNKATKVTNLNKILNNQI